MSDIVAKATFAVTKEALRQFVNECKSFLPFVFALASSSPQGCFEESFTGGMSTNTAEHRDDVDNIVRTCSFLHSSYLVYSAQPDQLVRLRGPAPELVDKDEEEGEMEEVASNTEDVAATVPCEVLFAAPCFFFFSGGVVRSLFSGRPSRQAL